MGQRATWGPSLQVQPQRAEMLAWRNQGRGFQPELQIKITQELKKKYLMPRLHPRPIKLEDLEEGCRPANVLKLSSSFQCTELRTTKLGSKPGSSDSWISVPWGFTCESMKEPHSQVWDPASQPWQTLTQEDDCFKTRADYRPCRMPTGYREWL